MTDENDVTVVRQIKVNLIEAASDALDRVSRATGNSETDVVNRALQVYAYVEDLRLRGGTLEERVDGVRREVRFQ